MSYKILSTLALAALLFSCQENTSKDKTAAGPAKATGPASGMGCYEYLNKADTVTLRLIREGNSVSGVLIYHLDGKDLNKGTLQGVMRDNLLIANYSFMSEGTASERQVVFKYDQGTLTEGYGERLVQNDKEVFKDLPSLKFDGQIQLKETKCP